MVVRMARLRSRRYVRCVLKKSTMSWAYNKVKYKYRVSGIIHKAVYLHDNPYPWQAIVDCWIYLPVGCLQKKHRGVGKSFHL